MYSFFYFTSLHLKLELSVSRSKLIGVTTFDKNNYDQKYLTVFSATFIVVCVVFANKGISSKVKSLEQIKMFPILLCNITSKL